MIIETNLTMKFTVKVVSKLFDKDYKIGDKLRLAM